MTQYISKSALVAEIENLLDKGKYHEEYDCAYRDGNNGALYALKGKLNTLSVKEVDLGFQRFAKEMDSIFALPSSETENTEENPLNWEYAIAKHFFELGMQVSNKQIEEKENIDSPEEKCNTVYKNITMINMNGNIVKSKIEQREKV